MIDSDLAPLLAHELVAAGAGAVFVRVDTRPAQPNVCVLAHGLDRMAVVRVMAWLEPLRAAGKALLIRRADAAPDGRVGVLATVVDRPTDYSESLTLLGAPKE